MSQYRQTYTGIILFAQCTGTCTLVTVHCPVLVELVFMYLLELAFKLVSGFLYIIFGSGSDLFLNTSPDPCLIGAAPNDYESMEIYEHKLDG